MDILGLFLALGAAFIAPFLASGWLRWGVVLLVEGLCILVLVMLAPPVPEGDFWGGIIELAFAGAIAWAGLWGGTTQAVILMRGGRNLWASRILGAFCMVAATGIFVI